MPEAQRATNVLPIRPIRYVSRHGLRHIIEVRGHKGPELRYVTDEELAALGLVAQ